MKKTILFLSVSLVMVAFLQSCTKKQLEVSEPAVALSAEESAEVFALRGGRDCEAISQDQEIFLPDTEAEITFLKSLEGIETLNKNQIEAYSVVLGFEDFNTFQEYCLRIISSDCDFSLQDRPEGEPGDCLHSFEDCVFFARFQAQLDLDRGWGVNGIIHSYNADLINCAMTFMGCN